MRFLLSFMLLASIAAGEVDFETEIQPIFENKCYKCHSDKKQKGGLALHKKHLAFKETDSGEVVIKAGDESSLLLELIEEEDEDLRMPPFPKDALEASEIAKLKQWIKEGANWPGEAEQEALHWAYVKPKKTKAPLVKNKAWPSSFIDHYVLARLEKQGLKPQDQALPETLIRRLCLDLTGLPPDLELVDRFNADPSDRNYEKIVDELLASSSYGEHWARHWLDLARYADSDGYQRDGFRTVWPYRDWVIKAFNLDKPFDEFTVEQLAGDLIPNHTEDQLIATGFNRCSPLNLEAGSDVEEDRVKQVVERVNTMGTIWLGSSLSCSQCHNHKYDPFTAKQYYQFYAYFNNTPREGEMKKGSSRSLFYTGPNYQLTLPGQDESLAKKSQKILETQSKIYTNLIKKLSTAEKNQNLAKSRKIHLKKFAKNPELNQLWQEIQTAQIMVRQHSPIKTQVMKEMASPRQTHVLRRGNFLDPDQKVEMAVPDFLHSMPSEAPKNRLGLAQWLVSKENPLMARATVNRFWREFFGNGLYESLEDIGKQGEAPTHPQLLDALAMEFMEKDWSIKHLFKSIVLSSTYRQSSVCSDDKRIMDPFNRLLSRGPSFRLNAEAIRDNALKISGLLSDKMYGPAVHPPQPENIWRVAGNVDNKYRTSKAADKYRRGLYTIWRRSAHYPSFANFDAPNRSACTVKRSRSNTPLQALTLMNDPVYVEMAQAFGKKIKACANTDEQRVIQAFRLSTARYPNQQELKTLLNIVNFEQQQNEQVFDPWFTLASVLLNLHETVSKD